MNEDVAKFIVLMIICALLVALKFMVYEEEMKNDTSDDKFP